jgi:hypothetical protein
MPPNSEDFDTGPLSGAQDKQTDHHQNQNLARTELSHQLRRTQEFEQHES